MKTKYRIKQHIISVDLTDINNIIYNYSVERYISNCFIFFTDWEMITNYEPITKDFLFSSPEEAEETLKKYLNFQKHKKEIEKQNDKIVKTFKL
jgi:hypothetical protein